jgi:hypothetical protein
MNDIGIPVIPTCLPSFCTMPERKFMAVQREQELTGVRQPSSICLRAQETSSRTKDIEDEEAMSFFGGSEGDADESQG